MTDATTRTREPRAEHPGDADRQEQDRLCVVSNERRASSWDDCRKGEEHWQFGNSGAGW